MNSKTEFFLVLAVIITLVSHIPQAMNGGKRVISDPDKFWTIETLILHAIVGIILILAAKSYKGL